jgi:hypothetical protein
MCGVGAGRGRVVCRVVSPWCLCVEAKGGDGLRADARHSSGVHAYTGAHAHAPAELPSAAPEPRPFEGAPTNLCEILCVWGLPVG